ncbi:F-box protein pof13 [Schizosaccharomyces pombe]
MRPTHWSSNQCEVDFTAEALTTLSLSNRNHEEDPIQPVLKNSNLFLLNRDIWSLIINYLDAFDILRLMHSSRQFYYWLRKSAVDECCFNNNLLNLQPYQRTVPVASDLEWATEVDLYGNPPILKLQLRDSFVWSMLAKFQGLQTIALDGTGVTISSVTNILLNIPTVKTLSIRWCVGVCSLSLIEFLQNSKSRTFSLENLYVLGVKGLELLKPVLLDGSEDDTLTSNWHSRVILFQNALDALPTTHGNPVECDISRCPLNACKIAGQETELADLFSLQKVPACIYCLREWKKPICRYCIDLRSCLVCDSFVCPSCISLDFDLQIQAFARQHRVISTLGVVYPEREDSCFHKIKAAQWHQISPRSLLFQFQEQNHIHHKKIRRKLLAAGWKWPQSQI